MSIIEMLDKLKGRGNQIRKQALTLGEGEQ
jgi:hypothetical protein